MNDSALRDIIPSNDHILTKKLRKNRLSNICKIIILIFILGVLAIGIVLLGLILIFSGKSFMNYIINSSEMNSFSLSNKTKENLTITSDIQNWKKITLIPTSVNEDSYKLLSTKQQQRSTQSMKLNDTTIHENEITTSDILTSTVFNEKIPNYEKIPLTTQMVLQSSTNRRKFLLEKYKKLDDDELIDDLLDS